MRKIILGLALGILLVITYFLMRPTDLRSFTHRFTSKYEPIPVINSTTPISQQNALEILRAAGVDLKISGIDMGLHTTDQAFLSSYTGPGSPLLIQGAFWMVKIPAPSRDPECWSNHTLIIDAQTGKLYDLGTRVSACS